MTRSKDPWNNLWSTGFRSVCKNWTWLILDLFPTLLFHRSLLFFRSLLFYSLFILVHITQNQQSFPNFNFLLQISHPIIHFLGFSLFSETQRQMDWMGRRNETVKFLLVPISPVNSSSRPDNLRTVQSDFLQRCPEQKKPCWSSCCCFYSTLFPFLLSSVCRTETW